MHLFDTDPFLLSLNYLSNNRLQRPTGEASPMNFHHYKFKGCDSVLESFCCYLRWVLNLKKNLNESTLLKDWESNICNYCSSPGNILSGKNCVYIAKLDRYKDLPVNL